MIKDRQTTRVSKPPQPAIYMTRYNDLSGGYFSADGGKTPVALATLVRDEVECATYGQQLQNWLKGTRKPGTAISHGNGEGIPAPDAGAGPSLG